MEENHKSLEDKLKALEAKLSGRMDNLDRKVDEVEKHTTWRIKDCEDLLRSRINDTYVDDAIRLLEERLTKEVIVCPWTYFNMNRLKNLPLEVLTISRRTSKS